MISAAVPEDVPEVYPGEGVFLNCSAVQLIPPQTATCTDAAVGRPGSETSSVLVR